MNDLTADIRINGPNIISSMLRILNIALLRSGNIDLEKYIANPKTKVTIGGGILLFMNQLNHIFLLP